MKQALTAGGQISVWFESAKLALDKIGIDFEEDRNLPGLKGTHPEYGSVKIEFFVPAPGKTKMEISVQDAALITEFKKIVIPAFKYFSALTARREESAVQAEKKPADTAAEPEGKPSGPEQKAADWVIAPPENMSAGSKNADESKEADAADEQKDQIIPLSMNPQVKHCKYCQTELQAGDKVCPKCGKKQNNGLLIAGIVAGVVVLLGLAAFGFYTLIGKQNQNQNTDTSQTTSTTQDTGSSESTDSETVLVTIDQYKQVDTGMTYEEICSIMGREGTFLEPATQITDANGEVATLKTYYWEAEGPQGANVCVTFQNDAAATISQYGLE